MTLMCDETRKYISASETLMAGTRVDIPTFWALCGKVIEQIPQAERLSVRRKPDEGGIDIYHAESGMIRNERTIRGFKLRAFAFSITAKTAERYLSNHLRRYRGNLTERFVRP